MTKHLGAPCVECRAIYHHFAMCTKGPGVVHESDTLGDNAAAEALHLTPNTPEPPPVANDQEALWPKVQDDFRRALRHFPAHQTERVLADMRERDAQGRAKYSVALQPHNGRDAVVDLYQELLDASVYAKQILEERSSNEPWQVRSLYDYLLGHLVQIRQLLP